MNTCNSCMFFDSRNCFCRKNPPIAVSESNGQGNTRVVSRYPVILRPSEDFCGSHCPKGSTNESIKTQGTFLVEQL